MGIQRGIVTPAGGRSPLITETQLLSTAFFVRTVVGVLSSFPPLPEPPHAARTDANVMSAADVARPTRDLLKRELCDITLQSKSSTENNCDARVRRECAGNKMDGSDNSNCWRDGLLDLFYRVLPCHLARGLLLWRNQDSLAQLACATHSPCRFHLAELQ